MMNVMIRSLTRPSPALPRLWAQSETSSLLSGNPGLSSSYQNPILLFAAPTRRLGGRTAKSGLRRSKLEPSSSSRPPGGGGGESGGIGFKNISKRNANNNNFFKNNNNNNNNSSHFRSPGPIGGPLLRPFLFATTTSIASFSAAAIYKYEDLKERARRLSSSAKSGLPDRFLRMFEREDRRKKYDWREWCNTYWQRLSVGERMALGVAAVNLGVFLLWRSPNPAIASIMTRYFVSSPFGAAPCISMLCSMFSHTSLTHLGVNMFCLFSFAPTIVNLLGKEQTAALYISAGLSSAFLSYAVNVARGVTAVSVGASGAILGLAGAVCMAFPEAKLSIIFLPWYPFPAKYALSGILAFDTLGVLGRWAFFDHAGHLGGTLFGVAFIAFAQNCILQYQKELVDFWHQFRFDS